MKTTDEIQSAIGNISYYADRIESLTKEQYNYDCDNCETILDMTSRLDLLCVLAGATRGVSLLCEQMSNNLQHAIEAKTTIKEKLVQEELL